MSSFSLISMAIFNNLKKNDNWVYSSWLVVWTETMGSDDLSRIEMIFSSDAPFFRSFVFYLFSNLNKRDNVAFSRLFKHNATSWKFMSQCLVC